MDVKVTPRSLGGVVDAIASKSYAHRMLICAALCPSPTAISCNTSSKDIEATIGCLTSLGAAVTRMEDVLLVSPIPRGAPADGTHSQTSPTLDCGESGSTLRFLLPVAAALGAKCSIDGHGRLSKRPLSPLYEELVSHGSELGPQGTFPLDVSGALRPGTFRIPGNVSSQYVSGLLMALPLLDGLSKVVVEGTLESKPYVDMTIEVLSSFGVDVTRRLEHVGGAPVLHLDIPADATFSSPGRCSVEGDWSCSAFWLCAGAIAGSGVGVSGLNARSCQGDRSVLGALALLGARVLRQEGLVATAPGSLHGTTIDVRDIPDLVPPLAAVAAAARGETRMANAGRLRLKESDRLVTVRDAITSLGGSAHIDGDDLVIIGTGRLRGGSVDAANDHRIAMLAAIASSICDEPVTVIGAECVGKSYPAFFEDLVALGGECQAEQQAE